MDRNVVIKISSSGMYSLLIVLLPILGYLKSPLPFMNFGSFLLLIISPFVFLKNYGRNSTTIGMRPLVPYLVCITIQSMIYYAIYGDDKGIIPALYMWFTCLITLHYGLRKTFDLHKARKYLEVIGIVLTCSVLAQYLIYLLTGAAISLFPDTLLYDTESFSTEITYVGNIPRFGGIFPEPAHFSQYVIFGLISALIPDRSNETKIKKAVVMTIGLLLTTSGMGLILGVLVWMSWYILYRKEKITYKWGNILVNVLLVMICTLVLFTLAIQLDAFQTVVGRIFGDNNSSSAVEGRTWAYIMYMALDFRDQIYGVGYGFIPPIFMASVPFTLYTTGVFGMVALGYSLISILIRSKGFSREVCFIFTLMLFFTGAFNQRGVAFYYSLMVAGTALLNITRNQQG